MNLKYKLIILLAMLSAGAFAQGLRNGTLSKTCYLFIGSYTSHKGGNGIYVYRFNSETGKLTKASNCRNLMNPSFLAVAPDGKYLYACTETKMVNNGSVTAFSFDSVAGTLRFINKQYTGGDNPVYVTVDATNHWVIDGNYDQGSVTVYGSNSDGSLTPPVQNLKFTDKSVDPLRQEGSHVHATVLSPGQDYLYVTDLGADKIRVFHFNPATAVPLSEAQPAYVSTTPGSGPRHLTFHPDGKHAYCIEELTGTISVYNYENGQLQPVQRIVSYAYTHDDYASADIHVSPDGRFLYATNRDNENTISIFAVDPVSGQLKLVDHVPAGGYQPRNFVIDPSGNYLLVANVVSSKVRVFKIDKETGALTKTKNKIRVPNPACLKMRVYGE